MCIIMSYYEKHKLATTKDQLLIASFHSQPWRKIPRGQALYVFSSTFSVMLKPYPCSQQDSLFLYKKRILSLVFIYYPNPFFLHSGFGYFHLRVRYWFSHPDKFNVDVAMYTCILVLFDKRYKPDKPFLLSVFPKP